MTKENTPPQNQRPTPNPTQTPADEPIENITETDLIGLVNSLEELLVKGAGRPRGMLMRQ